MKLGQEETECQRNILRKLNPTLESEPCNANFGYAELTEALFLFYIQTSDFPPPSLKYGKLYGSGKY